MAIVKELWQGQRLHFRDRHLILRVHANDNDSDTDLETRINNALVPIPVDSIRRRGARAYVRLRDSNTTVPDTVDRLNRMPDVRYAIPDLAMEPGSEVGDPLDHLPSNEQWTWALNFLQMHSVWTNERGRNNVVVGIIDTGITLQQCPTPLTKDSRIGECIRHEDLDGDRFYAGQSYVTTPPTMDLQDSSGHGTKMAGIIAAKEQNSKGILGMNHTSPVYICKVVQGGWATHNMIIDALDDLIEFAGDRKVVANVSLNYSDTTENIVGTGKWQPYIEELSEKNAVICCCAGNSNGTELVRGPAAFAYYSPNVVSVSAMRLDSSDKPIPYKQNYGGTADYTDDQGVNQTAVIDVSLAAPGYQIYTTDNNGTSSYATETGTSEATAFVTGLVSLMLGRNPDMSPGQIVQCLKNNCRELPDYTAAEARKWVGSGIMSPVAALKNVKWSVVLLTPSITLNLERLRDEPTGTIAFKVKSCADIPFNVRVEGDFNIYRDNSPRPLRKEEWTIVNYRTPALGLKLRVVYPRGAPDVAHGLVKISWNASGGTEMVTINGTRNIF